MLAFTHVILGIMLQMWGHLFLLLYFLPSFKFLCVGVLRFGGGGISYVVVLFLPDSQTETEVVTKTDVTQEEWKSDDDNLGDSWEKEVEDLVTWTNTLDTDALEDY